MLLTYSTEICLLMYIISSHMLLSFFTYLGPKNTLLQQNQLKIRFYSLFLYICVWRVFKKGPRISLRDFLGNIIRLSTQHYTRSDWPKSCKSFTNPLPQSSVPILPNAHLFSDFVLQFLSFFYFLWTSHGTIKLFFG